MNLKKHISFRLIRNTCIGVLLLIILSVSALSYNNVNNVSRSLEKIIMEDTPLLEKIHMAIRLLEETRYSFDLYVRSGMISLNDIMVPLNQVIEECRFMQQTAPGDEKKIIAAFTEHIKRIKIYITHYSENEQNSASDDTADLMKKSALENLNKAYTLRYEMSSMILKKNKSLNPSFARALGETEALLNLAINSFERYIQRSIRSNDILVPLDKIIAECDMLETMVRNDEKNMIKELTMNSRKLRGFVKSYIEHETAQGSGNDTLDIMEKSIINIRSETYHAFLNADAIVRKRIESAQQAMLVSAAHIKKMTLAAVMTGFFTAVLVSLLMNSALMKPINILVHATGKLADGDLNHRIRLDSRDEFGVLADSFNKMTGELQRITVSRDELEKSKNKAEAASLAKSEFIANMGHEIRTPLNTIMGFADIIMGKNKDKDINEYAQSIKESGMSLLTLINDILELSKIENGKMELENTAVNIHFVFNEIKEIFSREMLEKGLKLKIDIDPVFPQNLCLDEMRFRQILLKLVGNAVKFTKAGYIRLSAHASKNRNREKFVDFTFKVEDTGIGIPKNQRKEIFKTFEQVKGQDYADYGGTGMGLAITGKLVEMMGGRITVNGEQGKGSIFTVLVKNVMPVNADEIPILRDKVKINLPGKANSEISGYHPAPGKTGAEQTAPVYLSPRKELLNLLNILNKDFVPRLEKIKHILILDDVKQFCSDLESIAADFKNQALACYCGSLDKCAADYNIAGIKKMIRDFPLLVENLERMIINTNE